MVLQVLKAVQLNLPFQHGYHYDSQCTEWYIDFLDPFKTVCHCLLCRCGLSLVRLKSHSVLSNILIEGGGMG
jgi:hypothetical protein